MPYRSRVEDNLSTTCPCVRYDTYAGSPETVSSSTSWGNVGSFRSMEDVYTPGFIKLRSTGHIINGPMVMQKYSVINSPKGLTITRKLAKPSPGSFVGARWTDFSSYCISLKKPNGGSLPVPFLISDTSMLERAAITEAYSKVGSPDIQTLVSVAEGRQAVQLLANPLKGILQVLRSFPSMSFRRMSLGASQQWLATNFGMIPLLMDLQGAVRALSRRVETRVRETARAHRSVSDTNTTVRVSYSDTMFTVTSQRAVSDLVEIRAGVLYEHQLTLADRLGMTATYIPASLWEHLPWSFVFDYIVNIGNVIDAFTPKASTNTLAAWVSINHDCRASESISDFSFTDAARAGGWTVSSSMVGGAMDGHYVSKRRRPVDRTNAGFAIDVQLSDKRIGNLVALLTQRILR